MKKKSATSILWIIAFVLAIVFSMTTCDSGGDGGDSNDGYYNDSGGNDGYHGGGSDGYGSGGGDGYGGNGGNSSRWLATNFKNNKITDSVAGNIVQEINQTWLSYIDDKHYEYQYNSTTYNTIYTTWQVAHNGSRNGNTGRDINHLITVVTDTANYVNDITTTTTTVYHEESGLTLSLTSEATGTQNGNPYYNYSVTNYTLELLNTAADGAKTYKSYKITTDEMVDYTVYKVKNGITLEQKTYTSGGLYITKTNIFPDDPVIRTKLPNFSINNTTYESNPANNSYQTCEVVYDSSTELIIRIKTYTAGILTQQYDETLKPFNVPF
jgi:hypothetical protein